MKKKSTKNSFYCYLIVGLLIGSFTLESLADDLDSIAKFGMDGAPMLAIERLDRYIVQHPNETQAQLLKGMLLSMANKKAEAIKLFSNLMAKHPDIPAAGNNLAVVYASQHEYEKAIKLLQSIIKQHPDYLNAQKNLGDIYTELATTTYANVYEANAMDGQTKAKYEALKQLQAVNDANSSAPSKPVAQPSDPVKTSATPVKPNVPVMPSNSPPDLKAQTSTMAASSAVTQSSNKAVGTTNPSTSAKSSIQTANVENAAGKVAQNNAVKIDSPADPSQPIKQLSQILNDWADAWSQQNVQSYLSYYAGSFRTPNGMSLEAWKLFREERIKKPRVIKVEVSAPIFSINKDSATVVFMQSYEADNKMMNDKKRMDFVFAGGKWMIENEKVINP